MTTGLSTYSSAGVTFATYSEILAWAIAQTTSKFGASTNTNEDQWLGHVLRLMATLAANSNDIQQMVYDALSIQNASGSQLDNLVALIGQTRQPLTYSTTTLTFTATDATTVSVGTEAKTATGSKWKTTQNHVFGAAGYADIPAVCTTGGRVEAAAGEINALVNSVYGISGVTNAAAAVPGANRESDQELKEAHTIATSTAGADDLGSIYEALRAVTGNSAAYVNHNVENYTVGGIPKNSVHCSVIGGSSADIGSAIDKNITATIKTFGSQYYDAYNTITKQQTRRYFDRASNVPLYIDLSLTVMPGLFPDNGADQIKTNFVSHFSEFRIAQDVVYDAMWVPVYRDISGIISATMEVAITDPPGSANVVNIPMTYLQRALLDSTNKDDNISISVSS